MRYKSLPEWEFTSATRLAAGTWTRLSRVFRGQAAPAAGAADLERHRLQIDGVMHQGVGDAQQRLARHRLVHSSGERAQLVRPRAPLLSLVEGIRHDRRTPPGAARSVPTRF